MFCVQLFPVNLYNKSLPCLHGDWSCIMCVCMSVQVIANSEEEHACTHTRLPTHTEQVSTAHKFVGYIYTFYLSSDNVTAQRIVPSTLGRNEVLKMPQTSKKKKYLKIEVTACAC